MTNYPVGDFLIRIKNASLAKKREVTSENTKLNKAVARTLKDLGYLNQVKEDSGKLTVQLAYHRKDPLISDLRLISKPGLRIYMSADDLEKQRGPSVSIITTSKGVMSSRQAIKERLGGEVIVEIL